MGKYTSILRGLPSYKGEDATQAEKIAAKRAELGVLTAVQAATGYRAARDVKDELAAKLEDAQVIVKAYEEILQETYEMEGVTSLKLADGSTVSTFVEPYASVKNPLAFRKWVQEQPGLEQRMTLPWTTTNSITKEMLLDGDEPPPGVEVFVKSKTRLAR
jgi:hypothetical protein